MLSPFPGMDPYLEDPSLWMGFHHLFITYLFEKLNKLLPRGYRAFVGVRLYVVAPRRNIYPDAVVSEDPRKGRGKRTGAAAGVIDPPRVILTSPVQRREAYVAIRREGNPDPVTVLELLSPANKDRRDTGFKQYRTKQRELLRSRVSLLEIDLLRRGRHAVAIPRAQLNRPANRGYVVCLHRGWQGRRYEVWEPTVRDRLPRVAVPLLEGDPDVGLDLQEVFNHYYKIAHPNGLDYQRGPYWPLEPEDATWAEALLRERGLRDVS